MNAPINAEQLKKVDKKYQDAIDLNMKNVLQNEHTFRYPFYDNCTMFYSPSSHIFEYYGPEFDLRTTKTLPEEGKANFIITLNDTVLYVTVLDETTLKFQKLNYETGSLEPIKKLANVKTQDLTYLKVFTDSSVHNVKADINTEDEFSCNLGFALIRTGNEFFEGNEFFAIDNLSGDQACVYCSLTKMVFRGLPGQPGGYAIYDKNEHGVWEKEVEE